MNASANSEGSLVPGEVVTRGNAHQEAVYLPSALALAQPLDILSTRFALQAIVTLGPKFNLRRDINNLVTLC